MARVATVHVVPGTPRPVWCNQCHTSAAVEVDLYALVGSGGPYHVGTLTYCTECDDVADAAQTAVKAIEDALEGQES